MIEKVKYLNPLELKPALDVIVITDMQGLEVAKEYLTAVSTIAADVETNMTDDHTDRFIRTIQFGDKNKQFVIDLLPFAKRFGLTLREALAIPYNPHICMQPIVDLLTPILDSSNYIKIGHNLQFDYQCIFYNLGIRMWNLYDTLLAEKAIYAGRERFTRTGFWALDDLVLRYTGLIMSKDEQKNFDLSSPLTESQITYCALDCRLPFAIRNGQIETLTKSNLWKADEIENNVIPAFGDMYLNGIAVDKKRWIRNVHNAKKAHKRHIAKLDEFFIPLVGRKTLDMSDLIELETKWREEKDKVQRAENRKAYMTRRKQFNLNKKNFHSFEGEAAVNYASPVVLFRIMKEFPRLKGEGRFKDTNDRTLKAFSEHPNWDWSKVKELDPNYEKVGMLDTLRLYRETGKLLTSFGVDWLRKNINPRTGKIHAHFQQYGAETGRTSCSNPNLQQIPRGSDWRKCFFAESEDEVLITMDMAGAEMVILAELSGEPAFIQALQKGWDIHSVGGEIVFAQEWKDAAEPGCAYYASHQKCKCKRHKELRTIAKVCGLGIAYGMEYKKLAEETGLSDDEAKDVLIRYRKSFPVLMAYLEKSGQSAKDKLESRTFSQRRRLFIAPSYKQAIVKATLKNKKYKLPNPPTQKQINQCFRAMFESIEREGKNTPLQGGNADIAKIVMGCSKGKDGKGFMWHGLRQFGAKLVLFVHDEFVVKVSKSRAEECALFMQDCVVRGAAELMVRVAMGVEFEVKKEWTK